MTLPLSSQKRYLLEAFQGEITPATVRSFQGRLIHLVHEYKTDPGLIPLFKEILETANNIDAVKDLQNRSVSEAPTQADPVQDIAFKILLPETMKQMLRSRIEALESTDSEEALRHIQLEEQSELQETATPSQELLEVLDFLRKSNERESIYLPTLRSVIDGFQRAKDCITAPLVFGSRMFQAMSDSRPLLRTIINPFDINQIVQAVMSIPSELRSDVIKKAEPFLKDVTNGRQAAGILLTTAEIPVEQRTGAVIEAIRFLFRDISYDFEKIDLLTAVTEIAPDQRADVVEKSEPFLKDVKNYHEIKYILQAVGRIPQDQRADVIEKAAPFLKDVKDYYEIKYILQAFAEIAPDQRADVIEKAAPFFKDVKDYYNIKSILQAVAEIAPDQRADVVEKAEPLLKDVDSYYQITDILQAVGRIPEDQRADVLEKAAPFLKDVKNYYEIKYILQAFAEIAPDQRADVLEKAKPLLKDVKNYYEIIYILQDVGRIPEDQRAEAVDFAKTCKSLAKQDILETWIYIPSRKHFRIWQNVLTQLDKIHAPLLQGNILRAFRAIVNHWETRELFESPLFERLFSKDFSQPFRLLAALLWEGNETDPSLETVAAVLNSKNAKDVDRKKIILSAFHTLLETKALSSKEKTDLLKIIFSKDETMPFSETKKAWIDRIYQSLSLMETICRLGRFTELKEIKKSTDLVSLLESILKNALGMEKIENFSDRYLETFGSNRNPASLPVYMGTIEALPSEEKVKAVPALKLYVKEVLTKTFPASRYEETTSKHLAMIFETREELKKKWVEGKKIDFEVIFPSETLSISSPAFSAKEYLSQRVLTDRHISYEKVPFLAGCLKGAKPNLTQLDEAIQKLTQKVKNDLENRELKGSLDLLQLQKGLLSLLQATSDKQDEIFRSEVEPFIETALLGEEQFRSDLVGLGKLLAPQGKELSFTGWTAVDTDDPQDLLLCGTEVEGSCQSIHGQRTNRCLLAYLLDGKNRLIAVKDNKGRIVARSILRLLWDEKKQRPVLFKERVYSSAYADPKVLKALDRMCLLRAEELQLPLVAPISADPGSSLYPNALLSLGSRAPFEYSDAGGGVTDGTFKVTGLLLFDPATGGVP